MFKTEKKLYTAPVSKTQVKPTLSPFVSAAIAEQENVIPTGNGAKAYKALHDSNLTTQFGSLGSYKQPRSFEDISKDMQTLWDEDPEYAVRFAFYVRLISRKAQYLNGEVTEEPQVGGELKHEGIMRMLWLACKQPETFWKNVELIPVVGSWRDIFKMLELDLRFHGWEGRLLDWSQFAGFLLVALQNPNSSELVKKYLPSIRNKKSCKTNSAVARNMVAKWFCAVLFDVKTGSEGSTYKKYRMLKNSGTAHQWQQLISQKKFSEIEFDKIHGRALSKLVRSKFLLNQGLQSKYDAWVNAQAKAGKTVKFTGFVHELFKSMYSLNAGQEQTINLQFKELVNKTKSSENPVTPLIVVRDTSGSMQSNAIGTDMSSFDIGKALALFFSEFLEGKFANSWIEFNSSAKMHVWQGETPVQKWRNDHSSVVGNTNFQSVIDLFVNLKNQGVPEEEFPKGILCISDGEFDRLDQNNITNFEQAKNRLATVFSKQFVDDFVIILWDIPNGWYGTRGRTTKFETSSAKVKNVFYFSGYSASTVSLLTGKKIQTAEELAEAALNQEVLSLLSV